MEITKHNNFYIELFELYSIAIKAARHLCDTSTNGKIAPSATFEELAALSLEAFVKAREHFANGGIKTDIADEMYSLASKLLELTTKISALPRLCEIYGVKAPTEYMCESIMKIAMMCEDLLDTVIVDGAGLLQFDIERVGKIHLTCSGHKIHCAAEISKLFKTCPSTISALIMKDILEEICTIYEIITQILGISLVISLRSS